MATNSIFNFSVFKNLTPLQLSFLSAVSAATFITLLVGLSDAFGLCSVSWLGLSLLFFVVFSINLTANFFFVRYYIFRKIKLIYKIIQKQKMSAEFKADKIRMSQNVLGDVDREVEKWVETSANEQEELEKMAAFRRRFIGDVSHELKTPIFNIQGFVHTLIDGALDDPEVNMKYLQRAAKNIERLQTIVDDLETINKLEAGQMVLEFQEFDIHDLADEVLSELEIKAKQRNIRFVFKEGANQHFRVRADKESIRQVLINLVHNSIKYGSEDGTTKLSFYDMESYILIEISDNGIGIPTESLPHVFERFYRIDKHRSREAGGSGLGLSIVKHILEGHKQTINVRSTLGQGSTFGFTLQKA